MEGFLTENCESSPKERATNSKRVLSYSLLFSNYSETECQDQKKKKFAIQAVSHLDFYVEVFVAMLILLVLGFF